MFDNDVLKDHSLRSFKFIYFAIFIVYTEFWII